MGQSPFEKITVRTEPVRLGRVACQLRRDGAEAGEERLCAFGSAVTEYGQVPSDDAVPAW